MKPSEYQEIERLFTIGAILFGFAAGAAAAWLASETFGWFQ